jgi:hypothetical protein
MTRSVGEICFSLSERRWCCAMRVFGKGTIRACKRAVRYAVRVRCSCGCPASLCKFGGRGRAVADSTECGLVRGSALMNDTTLMVNRDAFVISSGIELGSSLG